MTSTSLALRSRTEGSKPSRLWSRLKLSVAAVVALVVTGCGSSEALALRTPTAPELIDLNTVYRGIFSSPAAARAARQQAVAGTGVTAFFNAMAVSGGAARPWQIGGSIVATPEEAVAPALAALDRQFTTIGAAWAAAGFDAAKPISEAEFAALVLRVLISSGHHNVIKPELGLATGTGRTSPEVAAASARMVAAFTPPTDPTIFVPASLCFSATDAVEGVTIDMQELLNLSGYVGITPAQEADLPMNRYLAGLKQLIATPSGLVSNRTPKVGVSGPTSWRSGYTVHISPAGGRTTTYKIQSPTPLDRSRCQEAVVESFDGYVP